LECERAQSEIFTRITWREGSSIIVGLYLTLH
jgi:hypothetical protein